MNWNKLRFSKCPNCKEHGIPFFKIGHHTNPVISCKCCKKNYKVNWALSFIAKIFIAILVGIISRIFKEYIVDIPLLVWGFIAIILLLVFEYFSPLEDVG